MKNCEINDDFINDEPSKEQIKLWDKKSELYWMLNTCYLIATDNLKKKSLLEWRIDRLKRFVWESDTEEDLNKMAYQILEFVHEFIIFRN